MLFGGLANAQTNITAMEYFIDDDPGMGNGIPLPFTSGPVVSESLNISTAALSPGTHFLFIRVQDEFGIWSTSVRRTFVIQATPLPPPIGTQVTAMEYFIDDDPGAGNGTPVTITPGPTVNVNLSVDVSALSSGLRHYSHRKIHAPIASNTALDTPSAIK